MKDGYVFRRVRCRCHPETCCCADYEIVLGDEMTLRGNNKKAMEILVESANVGGIDDYQAFTETTDIYPGSDKLVYLGLGVAGEAGEVADKIKKLYRDDNGELDEFSRESIAKEVGDVMWYLSRVTAEIGLQMSDILKMNVEKLSLRKVQGKLGGSGDNR